MNQVVEILMKRDGMSEEEATNLVVSTRDEVLECEPWEADDVIASNLSLEPDYLMDILCI